MAWKASQRISLKVVLIALGAGLGFSLFGAEPPPTEARPITCRVANSEVLPSQSEFQAAVDAQPGLNWGPRTGAYEIKTTVPATCLRQLGRGAYLLRSQHSVKLQLSAGWPESSEYSEYPGQRDASIISWVSVFKPTDTLAAGWSARPTSLLPNSSLSGLQWLGQTGVIESPLTDLCFAERCNFSTDQILITGDTDGESIYGILTTINMCFRFVPANVADTVLCYEQRGRDVYAHPGTFGMQVRIDATFYFEPLWTWRR